MINPLKKTSFQIAFNIRFFQSNHYDTLGVQQSASSQQIKKKYYQQAKKYHPDVCQQQRYRKKFMEITQAYKILSDDKKRKNYDNSYFNRNTTYQSVYSSNDYMKKKVYQQYQKQQQSRKRTASSLGFQWAFRSAILLTIAYALTEMFFVILKPMTQSAVRRQNLFLANENIDSSPSAIERRKKQYAQEMKQKNIKGVLVDLKFKSNQKQSTRSKEKRKSGLGSIKGIKKKQQQKDLKVLSQQQFM